MGKTEFEQEILHEYTYLQVSRKLKELKLGHEEWQVLLAVAAVGDLYLRNIQDFIAVYERCSKHYEFVKWAFENSIVEGGDLDGGSVQDKLEELGLIEKKAVDPTGNDLGAEELYFLKE